MKLHRLVLPFVLLTLGAANPSVLPGTAEVGRMLATPLVNPAAAADVDRQCDAAITLGNRLKAALEVDRGKPTMATTFRAYDNIMGLVGDVSAGAYLISETNTAKPVREAGERCYERLGVVWTALSLSRPIYDRLAAIPKTGLDSVDRATLARQLTEYRIGGVDRDAATRAKIADLLKRIDATSLKFDGNIRDLKGETVLASAADLAGMPADYVAAHRPGADGKIHISTDYVDTLPVLEFADREPTRRAVFLTFASRAWPANAPVLRDLLEEREALAKLAGQPDFASLALADKMIGTPAAARAFLDRTNAAAMPVAQRDYAILLKRWQRIDPSATAVTRWNYSYVERLVKQEQYDVDSAQVRQYFTYAKARDGIFRLAHDLFGADIRPWRTPVWDKSVTAWELYDGPRLVGRFYLDPFPRDGKYTHAAQFPIRTGVHGRVPIGSLITNFPASGPMDHDDVLYFLHEFGHLLHQLYSGDQRWTANTMSNLESDFIEAPSQLLEEWSWDYETLATFASDPAGRPIPRDLVTRMNRARYFDLGILAKGELAYSGVSLDFYSRPAATLDFDRQWQADAERYGMLPYISGTHTWANFGHLSGYSASYYTYTWSKVIALDLFTRFQQAGLRDRRTAMAYRRLVLEPGSAKPAATLVSDFLGRPFTVDAYRARLEGR